MARKGRRQPAAPVEPRSPSGSAPAMASAPSWVATEWAILRALAVSIRHHASLLAIITAVAGLLRFVRLGNASMWMDEVVMLREAGAGVYRTISYRAHSAHLAPVSMMLDWFGESPTTLRLWSALLGTLAVPVLALAAFWIRGRDLAIAVGALAATNCFLVFYAQDGNYYGGMTFYTSLQLLALVLLYRHAVLAGLTLFAIAGFLNFRNHPISVLPVGLQGAFMLASLVLVPGLRRAFISTNPRQWKARPGLPMLATVMLAALVATGIFGKQLLAFISRIIDPSDASLTNVEFTFAFFLTHFRGLMVNFFRETPADFVIALLPATLLAISGWVAWRWRRASPAIAAVIGLGAAWIFFSYVVIFLISVNRNFNLRYFTYLVPPMLMACAAAVVWLAESVSRRFHHALAILLVIAVLPSAWNTLRLIGTDKQNYRAGAAYLAGQRQPGEPIILLSRNDRVEAEHFLPEAGLPGQPPALSNLSAPVFADVFSRSFPAALTTVDSGWIVSAWRYVAMPRLYETLAQGLSPAYRGTSKLGHEKDSLVYRWSNHTGVVFPNAAWNPAADNATAILLGPAAWRTTRGETLSVEGASRAVPNPGPLVPILPPVVEYTAADMINMVEHTRLYAEELQGQPVIRSTRDCSFDFLLYQPEAPRHLEITVAAGANATPIPRGLAVLVFLDGTLHGIYDITTAGTLETITVNSPLPVGNHRLSVYGTVPRGIYTPEFTWYFGGVRWKEGEHPAATPSMIGNGVEITAPWTVRAEPGLPGWYTSGITDLQIDENRPGPDGDPSIRIAATPLADYSFDILSPPMPVQPGTVLVAYMHLHLQGLETHELTPSVVFLDAAGELLPLDLHTNGPNIRGTTIGDGWLRRPMAVPVPRGAVAAAIGVRGYPVKGESTESVLWISSIGAGIREPIPDPMLPAQYFGVHLAP